MPKPRKNSPGAFNPWEVPDCPEAWEVPPSDPATWELPAWELPELPTWKLSELPAWEPLPQWKPIPFEPLLWEPLTSEDLGTWPED